MINIIKSKFELLLAVALLLSLCIFCSYFYTKHTHSHITKTVQEHAKVLSEPLWSYEDKIIDAFLTTVISRKGYEGIFIYVDNVVLFQTNKEVEASTFLKTIYLSYSQIITHEITRNGDVIGTLEVIWLNTTRVVVLSFVIFFTLIFIIFLMYTRIGAANSNLKTHVNRLNIAIDEIQAQKEIIELIFNVVPQGLLTLEDDEVVMSNASFQKMIEHWANHFGKTYYDMQSELVERLFKAINITDSGEYTVSIKGEDISFRYSKVSLGKAHGRLRDVISLEDISEIVFLQKRVHQSEKLEAVGQLASGIAHEINTPTQYVMTNMDFFEESIDDMSEVLNHINTWIKNRGNNSSEELVSYLDGKLEEIDWEFLSEELPTGVNQSKEGLQRIQSIVAAMKESAHPAGNDFELKNLNEAVETSVTAASSKWKHIAKVDLDLDVSLPPTPCFIDKINQVLLIMITNSSHAVEEQLKNAKEGFQGVINIKTNHDTERAYIEISDNGKGMSEEVIKRIFEPFYTTKEVGKGTGQGLAIAYDIVTKQHSGNIDVSSMPGEGTSFVLAFPLTQQEAML